MYINRDEAGALSGEGVMDTIQGVLMYAQNRSPNGIECDGCGIRINLDRNTWRQKVTELRNAGWVINSTWHGQAFNDYCPDCAK